MAMNELQWVFKTEKNSCMFKPSTYTDQTIVINAWCQFAKHTFLW